MFVTAVVIKDGAHRFIDGEDRELKKGYEMRLDNVESVWVNFDEEKFIQINLWEGIYCLFDPEFWFVSAVSEKDFLIDEDA